MTSRSAGARSSFVFKKIKLALCNILYDILFGAHYYCCREFFLTQFTDDENLEETTMLEVDLAKLSVNEKKSNTVVPGRSQHTWLVLLILLFHPAQVSSAIRRTGLALPHYIERFQQQFLKH